MIDAQKKHLDITFTHGSRLLRGGGGGFLMNNHPWYCIQYTQFTVDGTL